MTVDNHISLQQSAIVPKASNSKPSVVNLSPCDHPVHIDNIAHHQLSVVSSTPSNQTRNAPMRQPPNKIIHHDYPVTPYVISFEGSPTKVYAPPSSSIQAADAQGNNRDGIGDEDNPVMHYEMTFEENAAEVDVPPSWSTQAADA
ncbi:hypothetical protein NL676_002647 [Syzygium grande]|nr:hypothetical protein NL676_002647 [Syzygium grande]